MKVPDELRRIDPALYEELRRAVARVRRGELHPEAPGTTSLVHSAWLRLSTSPSPTGGDPGRLLALVSEVARRALVDAARERRSLRRGGGRTTERLPDRIPSRESDPAEILEIDDALTEFARRRPRQAKALEFQIFGDLPIETIASALGVSIATAKRDLAFARRAVARILTGEGAGES